MKAARLGMAIGALAALAACNSPGPQAAPRNPPEVIAHRVLVTGQQCGRQQAHLAQVTDPIQLRRLVDGDSLPAGPAGPPRADLARETVLWLGMGELRSSGGQVAVTRVEAEPPGRLVVRTQWTLPEPGQLYAMAVTRPCVVFSLPGGDYRTVRVLDDRGRERLATELSAGR